MSKPSLLVCRAIAPEVIARLEQHFEVRNNQADVPLMYMAQPWASPAWAAPARPWPAAATLVLACQVIYHNLSRLKESLEHETSARYVSKEELLRCADHLLLVLPYSATSHHAIDAAELALMKPTATLVNIARSGIEMMPRWLWRCATNPSLRQAWTCWKASRRFILACSRCPTWC